MTCHPVSFNPASAKVILLVLILGMTACKEKQAGPIALEPVPSPEQVEWQKMEMNMFVHFNMNTFTDKEWGNGSEDPSTFNPSDLDTRQWARIAKEAGMKGIILTAKHHDGFCLWPSEFTEHSVKNSVWKNGKGDVVRELATACEEFGLKMGIYLSPWDRNHPEYGRPAYIEYYRNQVKELLTNYGDIFEFWVDGANGGTGWYGGANEERVIDRLSYYDWDSTFSLVKSLQSDIIIFSDAGPGCRWVGNEQGWAMETNWSFLSTEGMAPGIADSKILQTGMPDGNEWIPAEADVSIRPGWYYHPSEDSLVKSPEKLWDIYLKSVGRNSVLLLNFPVDHSGKIHPKDSAAVMGLKNIINGVLDENSIKPDEIKVSSVWHADYSFGTQNIADNNLNTYWAPQENDGNPFVSIFFEDQKTIHGIVLQEPIFMGQRVSSFKIEIKYQGEWQKISDGTTIGYKRILEWEPVSTEEIRITFTGSRGTVLLSEINLF